MRTWPYWITYLVSVRDATTNFNIFVGSGSHYLLPLNFFWFWRRCILYSRLDYCNSVLHSLPWFRLQLLQSVLNSAARLIPPAYFLQDLFAYVQVFERVGPCLSFWSVCWHCSCCGSFWYEICSSRWSHRAGTQDRVGFKVLCCGWSEMLELIAGWTQGFVGWSRLSLDTW